MRPRCRTSYERGCVRGASQARAAQLALLAPQQAESQSLIPIAQPEFVKARMNENPLLKVPPASRGNRTGARLGSPREAGGTCRRGAIMNSGSAIGIRPHYAWTSNASSVQLIPRYTPFLYSRIRAVQKRSIRVRSRSRARRRTASAGRKTHSGLRTRCQPPSGCGRCLRPTAGSR